MQMFRVLAACLIAAIPALAQPPSRNPNAATLTHVHLNSADPEAATAFWKDFIGTSTYNRGSMNGVSTLGILILFTKSTPTGPSTGSVIDHLSFRVPDLQPYMEKLAKTPFKGVQPTPGGDALMIDGPDGVRIELIQDNSMYASLEFGHIHFHTAKPDDTQAWYAGHFGARPNTEDELHSSRVGGTTLTFSQADSAAPTAGRAIDHISFEVKDLQSFSSKLAAGGVKVESPQSTSENKVSTVYLTDPWGTRIEVTEAVAH